MSKDYLKDKENVASLKSKLQSSGLYKNENKLESINDHMATLVAKASTEGLRIQPVNSQ